MHKVLSPKLTHAVVREWLDSKEATLHAIIEAIASQLSPLATKLASDLLTACIHPDPRLQLVDSMLETLDQVDVCLQLALAELRHADQEASPVVPLKQAQRLINEAFEYCDHHDDRGVKANGPKGGAA